jgi:hypothetical protein
MKKPTTSEYLIVTAVVVGLVLLALAIDYFYP